MSSKRIAFGAKPVAPAADAWVQQGNGAVKLTASAPNGVSSKADIYTARLTIDVTPALRGRIKVEAYRQDVTVTEMIRDLLEAHFPDDGADT
ncbi:hypothetical protein ACUSIJ_27805 [Pseudochelatococcus sp. B33]